MTIRIRNEKESLPNLMRQIGYKPIFKTDRGELNCVRPLGADYPRFHIYAKEENNICTFNLHLDQKKPSYGEHTAHSGDYEGEAVEAEAARIKDIIFRILG